jgi:hypothetical protein
VLAFSLAVFLVISKARKYDEATTNIRVPSYGTRINAIPKF